MMIMGALCAKIVYAVGWMTITKKVIMPAVLGVVDGVKEGKKELREKKTSSPKNNKDVH